MDAVLDKAKIGPRIARGADRKVYMYGSDHVVKISSLSLLFGRSLHDKLVRDYEVCKRYFPEFVIDVQDLTPPESRTHIEIQPFIEGDMLQKKHMQNAKVRTQLEEIHMRVELMVKDGYPPIDLVGHHGMFFRQLSNIVVDSNNDLKIIDTTLLEGKSAGVIGALFGIVFPFVRWRQKRLISYFLR